MIEKETNGLKYIQFSSFPEEHHFHGIFTRSGGVSPHPFESLNIGGTTGDSRENVIENRKRIFDVFNRKENTLFDVWQVHGSDIIVTDKARPPSTPHLPADGILTNSPNVTLLMRFADCVPILLFDPQKKVVGVAHAGWQGTIKKVSQTIIKKMVEFYNCKPADIYAGIGPSIGPDHYDVGKTVIDAVNEHLPDIRDEILSYTHGKTILNLWKANLLLLQDVGLKNIEISEICTSCNIKDWYSYRSEGQKSGRFAVVIGLS